MSELSEKVIKTGLKIKCRYGRCIKKKKKNQIELKMETTISEMKNIPDGINGTLDIEEEKITELLGIVGMI